MELEKQVVSLELAKRLKELGVKQESLFWWVEWARGYGKGHIDYKRNLCWELRRDDQIINFENKFAAFTVAELGEMLPRRLELTSDREPHNTHRLVTEHQDTRFMMAYICADCHGKLYQTYADTEAAARAKMFIYLLQDKLV